jgi:hypothetical protein
MSDTNNLPNKDGSLRGDTKAMPMKGTETGLNGDTYGADLGQSALNGEGKITGGTKSNPMDQCFNKESTI